MSNEFRLWEGRTYRIIKYYVIDGDTIDAEVRQEYPPRQRHRIRLHGIDAPEITQPHGLDAAQHLRNLLKADPRPLYARITDPCDRYGRVVAILHRGTIFESVNAQMVQDGLAYAYYSDDYQRAENKAKQSGAGVWLNPDGSMRPWEYRRAQQRPQPRRNQSPDPPHPTPRPMPTTPRPTPSARQTPRPMPTPTPTPTRGNGCVIAAGVIIALVLLLIAAATCAAGPGPAESGHYTGANPTKVQTVALATNKGDAIQRRVSKPPPRLGRGVILRFSAVRRLFSSLRCPYNRFSGASWNPASSSPTTVMAPASLDSGLRQNDGKYDHTP